MSLAVAISLIPVSSGCAFLGLDRSGDSKGSIELPRVGASMKDICFRDMEGELICPCRNGAKLVLIEVFTTWCTPSVKRVAYMNRLLRNYGGFGLHVLGLSLDLAPGKVLGAFNEEMDPHYPLVTLSEDARAGKTPLGDLNIVPMAVLIDEHCKIAKVLPGDVRQETLVNAVSLLLK
ncbi:MAG: TlpA family protein disulfide reductase [Deltaproteobacteria bacterium]|nr:TlpA family protein disulfide reductase [Deltaproteobacteria bacterium]